MSALTSADAEAVANARAAYDKLTTEQKKLVPEETLTKLEKAEISIANWQQFNRDAAAAAAITTEFVKVKAKKGGKAVITWIPAEGSTGYILQYNRNKEFTKKLKEKELLADQTKLKIKKLKKGKKYYFRICTYTDIPNQATGTTERVIGPWSQTWKVKAKK